MLVVKIELWPGGDGRRAVTLAEGHIVNDGTGTPTQGNYEYTLLDKAGRIWRKGKIAKFARKRLNSWHLLARVLRDSVTVREQKEELSDYLPPGWGI